MDLKIPAFSITTPINKTITFDGTNLENIYKILITSDNIEDARIVAFSAFNFDQNLIKILGYNVKYSEIPNFSQQNITYTSPTVRAEVSRFSSLVEEEILLGLNTKISESEATEKLEIVSKHMGISHLLNRNPLHLSGGETAKVILASHIIQNPRIWIIDRTLNELDTHSRNSFFHLLDNKELLPDTLIIIIDYSEILVSLNFDKIWNISKTYVFMDSRINEISHNNSKIFSDSLSIFSTKVYNKHKILSISNLNVYRGEKLIIKDLSFDFYSGHVSWVIGKNGSGKTTLFEALTNIIKTWSGKISYDQSENNKPIVEIVSYSPQDSDIDITEDCLINEVAFALDGIKYDEKSKNNAKAWLLEIGMNEQDINNNSLNNNGDRKLASVFSAFARNKPIVILDEPTLFLSKNEMKYLNFAILNHLKNSGIVIIATHDPRLFNSITAVDKDA